MAAGRKAADVASRIEVDPNAVGSLLGNVRFNKEALEVASKQSDRSREILVNMPINDFLKAAKKEVSQEKLSGTRRLIENGETFDTVPSLAFVNNGDGTGKVVGHDGRHRAIALREAGEDTIPVLLSNQAGDGPSIRYGVQNDPNDRDYVDILPKTLIEEDGSGFVEMPSVAPSSPAEKIAGLLSSGRADDVTDEMLGKLTAQDNSELFDLYQSGATGMDLPMDEASRMARAGESGFNTNRVLYRGGGSDRKSLSADAGTFKTQNTGVFMDPNPMRAETYAKQGGGVVAPLLSRSDAPIVFGDMSEWNRLEAPSYAYDSVGGVDIPLIEQSGTTTTDDIARAARQRNLSAIEIQDVMDPGPMRWRNEDKSIREYPQFGTTRVEFDPANIRSRFARFDPRLANLKNLSAGVGAAPIGLLALREEQKRANEEQYKRGLLQ
jgi:hypothetical protein